MYSKNFLSLDLEATHLDMKEGRIMEAAAVECELYFDAENKKVKVRFGESFSSLVNPETEVPPAVLKLTGIKKEELQEAPAWGEMKSEFQKFLDRDLPVMGQNISFDIDYLKNQGLAIRHQLLDVLEISQTLLPLAPSHSLEYIAEALGVLISVSHRAYEDAKTAALVLAETLNQFLLLPVPLQKRIKETLKKSDLNFCDLIRDLPEERTTGRNIQAERLGEEGRPVDIDFPWEDQTLYLFPLSFVGIQQWLKVLSEEKHPAVVGVSHPVYLTQLPPDQKILNPRTALCKKRLSSYEDQQKLPQTAVRVLLKIMIAGEFSDPLDLSGVRWLPEERVFLRQITTDPAICLRHKCEYVKRLLLSDEKTYFTSLDTLARLTLAWEQKFERFKALLFDLSRLESALVYGLTWTENLSRTRELLAALYPLDESQPAVKEEVPDAVEDAANELDLFFGILHLVYLKREGEWAENIQVDEAEENSERFSKILMPAKKLAEKLNRLSGTLEERMELEEEEQQGELLAASDKLKKVSVFLTDFFFERRDEFYYWLRFDARGVDLSRAPRHLPPYWQKIAGAFERVSIVESELPAPAKQYFVRRLGLNEFQTELIQTRQEREIFKVSVADEEITPEELLKKLKEAPRSAILILANENQLDKHFEVFAAEQKPPFELLAYKHSGALSALRAKLLGREKNKTPVVFLVTRNAAHRYFERFPEADFLYIQKIPFEHPQARPGHRIFGADNDFMTNALPRAIHILHTLLVRFARVLPREGEKREIWLGDPRIANQYDRTFLNYLEDFPDFELEDK